MSHIDYKETYEETTLREMLSKMRQLADLYKQNEKYSDKLIDIEKDIENVRKAIQLYDTVEPYQIRNEKINVVLNNTQLSNDEKELIKAFQTSALGREGLLNDAFFTSNSKTTLKKLLLKGIVQEIKHFHHFNHLPNHKHYGLVGELYPQTSEEWEGFRDSGYSEKMSFKEYLHELKSGNIKWTSKKINKFIYEDVEEIFKQKFKSELIWINFIHLNGLETAKRLTRENNSPEDVLKQTLIQHINSSRFDNAQPIDLNWYKEIIEKAIEFLNNKKLNSTKI